MFITDVHLTFRK